MASPTNGGDAADQAGAQPNCNVITQYLKDFSFENPNAPKSLMQSQQQPQITIQVNVSTNQLSNTDFEVSLKVEGKAELTGTALFRFDLDYAGVFRLANIPQENVGPLLMIECPRLLFPFARELIASTISNGGFSPLLLQPIDFVALYQRRLANMQAQQPAVQA
jgi:preprotein translocase subunit SecB